MQKNPDTLIILECEKNSFDFIKSDWHYCNWYNDNLNNEDSKPGVVVFSNNYRIEFCECFNRNYRYVIPYRLNILNRSLILFVVWTKKEPLYYAENVLKALEDKMYKSYLESDCVFIGDFNTGTSKADDTDYRAILKRGLINKVNPEFEFKPTYFGNGSYYTNDYCFITEQTDKHFSVSTHILDLNEGIDGVNKYKGMSDHCPIIVDIEKNPSNITSNPILFFKIKKARHTRLLSGSNLRTAKVGYFCLCASSLPQGLRLTVKLAYIHRC